MSSILGVFTSLIIGLLASAAVYADGKVSIQKKRNQDGTQLVISQTVFKETSECQIEIYLARDSLSKPELVLEVTRDLSSSPQDGARFIDIAQDKSYEVEIQGGACSQTWSLACVKELYRVDAATKTFYRFSRGNYLDLYYIDGYLIDSASAGRRTWEYHAYRFNNQKRVLSEDDAEIIIEITSEVEDVWRPPLVECTFRRRVDENFDVIEPPSKNWLKLCSYISRDFKLVHPTGVGK